jgi:shikimate dehydrogenase
VEKNSQKFCLLGSKIQHSLSPEIQNFIFQRDGIDAHYELMDIPEDSLTPDKFNEMVKTYNGFNVTTPFKTIVAGYLKGKLDKFADKTGSVNTVKVSPDGDPQGFNTDVIGLRQGMFDLIAAQTFFPSRLILLGGGGVARSVIYSFIDYHSRYSIPKIPEIIVLMRDPLKNAELVNAIAGMTAGWIKIRLQFEQWNDDEIAHLISRSGFIINASSCGSISNPKKDAFDFTGRNLSMQKRLVAGDLVYNPSETIFLKTAWDAGAVVIGGLGVLVYQAIASAEVWFETHVSEDGIFERLEKIGFKWIR